MEYLFIGAGGVVGALTRLVIGKRISRKYKTEFPVGTFIINMSGAVILGFLINIFAKYLPSFYYLKSTVITGFLGAYTTFSTFSYEVTALFEKGEYFQAAKYVLLSYTLGIFLCYTAYLLSDSI